VSVVLVQMKSGSLMQTDNTWVERAITRARDLMAIMMACLCFYEIQ